MSFSFNLFVLALFIKPLANLNFVLTLKSQRSFNELRIIDLLISRSYFVSRKQHIFKVHDFRRFMHVHYLLFIDINFVDYGFRKEIFLRKVGTSVNQFSDSQRDVVNSNTWQNIFSLQLLFTGCSVPCFKIKLNQKQTIFTK